MADGDARRVDASLIGRYVESPFAAYCDLFAPVEERDPLDPYRDLLFTRGQKHESDIIAKDYTEAEHVEYPTPKLGFRETLEMMSAGVKEIYSMPLFYQPESFHGRPDLLIRRDTASSRFGSYLYAPIDIKSAKNLKSKHTVPTAFYAKLVGLVQGSEPPEFGVINAEGVLEWMTTHSQESLLCSALAGIRAIYEGETPKPSHGDTPWPWRGYGDRLAVDCRDLTLVPGIGANKRPSLETIGIATMDDVAKTTVTILTDIKGIGATTAEKAISGAQALVSGTPIRHREIPISFPTVATEVFLDLEGTDPRINTNALPVVNYLIGMMVRGGKQAHFQSFLAHRPEDEGPALMRFCEYVPTLGDFVIYHWHHYERTHLTKMMDHYEVAPSIKDLVLSHLKDLHPIATKAFSFPTYTHGLKDIAKSLGFNWRLDDVNATTSVALYQKYVDSGCKERNLLDKILIYNEDDCRATMYVKDWLQTHV